MTDQMTVRGDELDEHGPVDWIVLELPGSRFDDSIAPTLTDLVDRGIIRIPDLLMIRKDDDGALDVFEVSDLERPPRPVARTAAVVGTAAVVSHGVRRRGDRRDDSGDRREDHRDRRR